MVDILLNWLDASTPYLTAVAALEWALRFLMVPVILRRRFAPGDAIAWLALIFFIPELGVLIYFLIGRPRLGQSRVERHRTARERIREEAACHTPPPSPGKADGREPLAYLAQRVGGLPVVAGAEVELLTETDDVIDRLSDDIDAAERHVHLLFYIFKPDETGQRVADALRRAADRGVTCRLLADSGGSPQLFRRGGLAESLNEHGVRTVEIMPVSLGRALVRRIDVRNHRKLAVIDGHIAYAGSQNIVEGSYGHRRAGQWHDLTGRFKGPIVGQFQQVFVEDWACDANEQLSLDGLCPVVEQTGPVSAQVVATAPSEATAIGLSEVMLSALSGARQRIVITTPYFIPDEPTLSALMMAGACGVEVDIVVPHRSDHPLVGAAGRYYFEQLLDAGVRIHLHNDGLLHAKTVTIDDHVALLGSTNFDIRSFHVNYEMNVFMYGAAITQRLREAQMRYIAAAEPIDIGRWKERAVWRRYACSAAALLSPLL